jgi:hypothetical protein
MTAAILLRLEVRQKPMLTPVLAVFDEAQRLDIVSMENLFIEPGALHIPTVNPPVLHAAAPVVTDGEMEMEKTAWTLRPPPVPSDPVVHASAPKEAFSEHGVFLTPSSAADDEFLRQTMEEIEMLPSPALVIDVKGSSVYFPSGAPMATKLGLVKPLVKLPAIIAEAHRRGITVIGRFIALKDPSLASRKPETQIRHPLRSRSVGNVWVDGSNATTLQYNKEILEDLVQTGIDEINLDYIRYPTEYAPGDIGLSGAEKAEHIAAFLRMARDVIDRSERNVRLGISTFAILGWNFSVNFEPLGQDIPRFADIVDVISPMAYPSTFSIHAYYDPAREKGAACTTSYTRHSWDTESSSVQTTSTRFARGFRGTA